MGCHLAISMENEKTGKGSHVAIILLLGNGVPSGDFLENEKTGKGDPMLQLCCYWGTGEY